MVFHGNQQPLKLVLGCRPVLAQCRGSHGGETPISAWQPPIAADMVDPFLKILLFHQRLKELFNFFRPHYGFHYQIIHQYGRNPALPLVGAVTILPKAALTFY
jgi:hypothetical protein